VKAIPPRAPDGARIWALLSHRSGEGQQILGLAEALERELGWGFRILRPRWNALASSLGLLRRVGLAGVAAEDREPLERDSPDLVISASLRNEPVARWIARLGGGRTGTVFLGRTWAPADAFDLTVTTPQYRVRPHPRVLENPGTIHRLSGPGLAEARERWAGAFATLPRPRLGVLVGGDSGPFVLGPRAATRLAGRARALAGDGSVIVTTSARTAPAASAALARGLQGTPYHLWRWAPEGDNPYFGILAWADALLVTADSIAMVSEAVATGRPVRLFDLGGMRGDAAPVERDRTPRARAYGALMHLGPRRLSRDLGLVHERLVATGAAAWDDVPLPESGSEAPAAGVVDGYLGATVRRVKSIVEARRR
jgi:mitochondrial fission protein ELM1